MAGESLYFKKIGILHLNTDLRHRYFLKILIFWILILGLFIPHSTSKDDFFEKRKNMVESQIKARGIKDERVIEAMLKVERHLFVPQNLRDSAYEDFPLPIGEGQTISQPYIVALMTEVLNLKPNDKVLEIGTGSGYQAAVLAEIAKEVYTIEILPKLAERAAELLKDLGYKNIKVKCGDGYLGWPEYAPFDCIIVTCAPDHIPQPLIEQLKEGGRMVIPVGERFYQELILIEKKEGKIEKRSIIPVLFVPMIRK
jgi:protein-L-isoaspartate(D-aspartate) O-methyltransferase